MISSGRPSDAKLQLETARVTSKEKRGMMKIHSEDKQTVFHSKKKNIYIYIYSTGNRGLIQKVCSEAIGITNMKR